MPADLDQPGSYSQASPSGLGGRIRGLPAQCQAGWRQGMAAAYPPEWSSSESVTVCGMGGSAIAGDLLAGLVAAQKGAPVRVVRGFDFPFRIDSHSLIVVCSFSGDTRETIALFHQAQAANARIIAAAGGGTLAREAAAAGIPLLKVDLPGEPRSAVGYNLMLLAATLDRLGLWSISQEEVTASIEALASQSARLAEDQPTGGNPAKGLALALHEKLVMVYGGGLFSGLARRWKMARFGRGTKRFPSCCITAWKHSAQCPRSKRCCRRWYCNPSWKATRHPPIIERRKNCLRATRFPLIWFGRQTAWLPWASC